VFIFIDLPGGNFATDDAAKEAIGHKVSAVRYRMPGLSSGSAIFRLTLPVRG
jgi:hypothetical protein